MRNSIKKKVVLFALLFLPIFILSGCSFSDLMTWSTGVKEDPDYQTWEKLSDTGKLDAEGKYTADAVHVTFAVNGMLDIHYFSDPEMKNELPAEGCYLLPGDHIYAKVNEKHEVGGFYLFDHLDIIEYNSDNVRQGKLEWTFDNDEASSFMIPYDYKGTEISIEPAGRFGERKLVLKSRVENQEKSTGKWKVDGSVVSEDTKLVNPLDNYVVEYEYDPEKYYFVTSEPHYWNIDTSDGLVVFDISKAKSGTENYSVLLAPYYVAEINLTDGEIKTIKDEDGKEVSGKKDGRNWSVPRMRQNSTIQIVATTENRNNIGVKCPIGAEISDPEMSEEDGKKYYTYTIEFGNAGQFLFVPSEYQKEHGKLRFSCNGQEITESILLNAGMNIICEAVETEEGFWLPNDRIQITVNGKETENELQKIKFYPYRKVTVLLGQPKSGGTMIYQVNGEELTGESAELLCGSVIDITLKADAGWESIAGYNVSYVVTEYNNQIVDYNGKQVNNVFRELDNHKPKLKIEINKNIGKKCITNISAGGISKQFTNEEDYNFLAPFALAISDQLIGTDQEIKLVFQNMDFPDGKNALRIIVNKETTTENYSEIHYATTADVPVCISFYNNLVYKSVSIKIEAVNAESFRITRMENADMELYFDDVRSDGTITNSVQPETMVSDERQIMVVVKPHEGYFMTGANTNNDIYQRTMSYGDYCRLDIAALHMQMGKVCTINLDTSDPYGEITYTVDGVVCEGETHVRTDKEIRIKYKITNKDYIISNDRDIFTNIWSVVDSNVFNEIEIVKKVTMEDDGKTIRREDLIQVKRRGGE